MYASVTSNDGVFASQPLQGYREIIEFCTVSIIPTCR